MSQLRPGTRIFCHYCRHFDEDGNYHEDKDKLAEADAWLDGMETFVPKKKARHHIMLHVVGFLGSMCLLLMSLCC